ncbi:hypothetical protein LTS10_007139 [Elasticomyces elasticus]|nr:hypothetical protein LTS10_007139 [Elasticomyces elasticus]
MTSGKEWQVVRSRTSNRPKAGKSLTVSAKISTRVKSKLNKAPQTEDDSLWAKLPGEIRNQIYELMSASSASDPIDSICVRMESMSNLCHRWEEPGLLKTAKWIRREGRQIYFESSIHIALTTSEIDAACDWLRTVAPINREGQRLLGPVTLWLKGGDWNDIDSWMALASLVRDHEFKPTQEVRKLQRDHAVFSKYHVELVLDNDNQHRIYAALREVVAGGMRARREAWSSDELQAAYSTWTETILRGGKRTRSQRGRSAWLKVLPRMEKK